MSDAARLFVPTANAYGVNLLSPIDNALVNSANVPVSWAFAAIQDQYRVQIYSDAAGATVVFDSQWVTSSVQSATLATVAALTSNTIYYVRVFVHGSSGETAESDIESFFYALPTSVAIVGLRAVPLPLCNPTPYDNPAIRVSWTRPAPTETFLAYEVRRRKRGETTYVAIARIVAVATTYYLDMNVQPGQEYEYLVVFYGDAAGPITKLSAVQATPARATVTFDWIYLHEVATPQTEFIRLNAYEGSIAPKLDIAMSQTWGRARPTAFVGENLSHSLSVRGLDYLRKHTTEWTKFLRLLDRQRTGTVLCLRYGLDKQLFFVALTGLSKALSERAYQPSFDFEEVEYDEDIGLYVHTPGGTA